VVSLEARVTNSPSENNDGPPNHEIIYSGTVDPAQDPLTIVQGADEADKNNKEGHVLVLWNQSVVIGRPLRLRLQNPSVVFSASANLKPAEHMQPDIREDEYMPSQLPSGLNLLESFNNDPELGAVKPRLSALRVSRVVPASQVAADLTRPLSNISRKSIKVSPAFSVRVRYARPNTIPSNPSITASLDIDITSPAGQEVVLETVKFVVTEGLVEDLNNAQGMVLPMACLPRDDVTFLYRLRQDEQDTSRGNVKPVQILVVAKVKVSKTCKPHISMRWQTSVDFTPPVNPGFGQPSQPIRRDHRPAHLSIDSSLSTVPTVASLAVTRPDALPAVETTIRHQRSTSLPDFGVTMTFTDISTKPLRPGEEFTWEVFIVNRSDRARKLALIVVPKRRRTERVNHNRPPSTSYGRKDPNVADAVMDENIIHAMQKNSAMEAADLICYSTDVRVGPLAPSACHTVELRFMALKSGVIDIDAVRVVDVATQEHVDIRDLPSIIVSQ
jgi:hypothetical protein